MSAKCDYCGLIYPDMVSLKNHFQWCEVKSNMDEKLADGKEEPI